jgi:hypothetical protein
VVFTQHIERRQGCLMTSSPLSGRIVRWKGYSASGGV